MTGDTFSVRREPGDDQPISLYEARKIAAGQAEFMRSMHEALGLLIEGFSTTTNSINALGKKIEMLERLSRGTHG